MPGSSLLFVYGTLMRGFREDLQHKVQARFLGKGSIRARLYDLGPYPGAKLAGNSSEDSVKGELYQLGDAEPAIMMLDKYEAYSRLEPDNSLFIRDLVTVTLGLRSASDVTAAPLWSRLGNSISEPCALAGDLGNTLEGSRNRRAWTYLYNRPVSEAKLIPSGNYRERVSTL